MSVTAAPARRPKSVVALPLDSELGVWTCWYRPGKGRWQLVGRTASYSGGVALIGSGDRHRGDWLVTDREGRPLARGGFSEPGDAEVLAAEAAATVG